MKSFFAAIGFLTIIPLPQTFRSDEKGLEKGVPYFPVVGLLIGAVLALIDNAAGWFLPVFPLSVLTVILMIASSGGLHIDGLADSADGFFSARPRERLLEIMRDSRTGVMGVVAVVSVIAFKVSLLSSIPDDWRMWIILLMPIAGRSAIVIMMTALPYVRSTGGLASIFAKRRSWLHAVWAVLFLAVASIWAAQWIGFSAALATLIVTALFSFYCKGKIGGYTGDTLGAVCEIGELVLLLAAVVLSQM